jgi:CsoR family transcriptional regulator, copper-sensing transcriptional repressor
MAEHSTSAAYAESKPAILRRLSRIEGQVRGVRGMVSDEAYCIDLLTQIAAVGRALDEVALRLLSDHTNHCVRDAVGRGGSQADEKVAELIAAIERFARTR